MTVQPLECVDDWEISCLCGREHVCWPRPDTSCCEALQVTEATTPEQEATIERMLHVSTEILWRLSGKQFGACPVTVRPCKDDCGGQTFQPWWNGTGWLPYISGGQWFNSKCDKCEPSGCSCVEMCEVTLPGPVQSITEVLIDGAVVPPDSYRVDNGNKLVRVSPSVSVIPATDISLTAAFNFTAANVDVCTFVEPSNVQGMTETPPLSNCFRPDEPLVGQQVTLPPGCRTISVGVGPGNSGPIAFVGGPGSYVFPAATVLTAGGAFAVSNWSAGTRMRVRLVTGPDALLDVNGQTTVEELTTRFFEVCFDRQVTVGSDGCWPTCQNMNLPTTEPDTFQVTYRQGTPVPQSGLWAAGLFACQLIKACTDDAECALPANAQRVVRQGVTLELEPLLIDGTGFRTGIPEVDLWLTSVNPFKMTHPPQTYSPDRPKPRTTTWPCAS